MVYITQAALAVVAVLTGSHSTLGLKVQPSQNKLYWNTTGLCDEFGTPEEVARLTGGCARLEFCTLPGYVYEDGKFGYKMDGGKCLSPGPTMYMTPGMTYGFVLCSEETTDVNHPGTNVHTHGLHISGSGNSDDITRHIYPGSCGFYEYAIPENHMGGTHWYHPHLHFHTKEQASGGAVGTIIVEDLDYDRTVSPVEGSYGVYEFLTDKDRDLVILAAFDTENNQWINKNQDGNSVIYNLVKDVWYRLRILTVNPEAEPEIVSIPPECDAHAISHDGVYRFNPPKHREERYFLTGASRVDVAIKCSSVGTWYVSNTEGWSRRRRLQGTTLPTTWSDGSGWEGEQVIAALVVSNGNGTEPTTGPFTDSIAGVGTWPSWRPDYLQDLTGLLNSEIDNKWAIEMDNAAVNDLEYNDQCPLKDRVGQKTPSDFDSETIQQWTHLTVNRHPAHVHIWHQQILSNCGPGHDDGEYYDVIGDAGDSDADCKVRFKMIRYGGRETLHCHILKHEDAGTMGWIQVNPTPNVTLITPTSPCCISGECSVCIDENQQPNECTPWGSRD